jgi:peptidoglycan-N-acetylmuramic acid deacetylase
MIAIVRLRVLLILTLAVCLTLSGCKQAQPPSDASNNSGNKHVTLNSSATDNKQQSQSAGQNDNTAQNGEKPGSSSQGAQSGQQGEQQQQPSGQTTALDNTKHSWYFLPKGGHQQPGTEAVYAQLASNYKAIWLGSKAGKKIYLTFDEGYENGYTAKILDTLKANHVQAAFFITGPYLDKNTPLVERMVKEGHIVGNHTVSHLSLPTLSDQKVKDELSGVQTDFTAKTGRKMRYLRPPMGEFSERTLKLALDLGYRSVFWSFAYSDWDTGKQKGADNAYQQVIKNVHPGAVLLLHAVSRDNAEALDRIIKELKAEGYTFTNLDQFQ